MKEETPRPIMLYVENGMFMGKEMVFCKDCKWYVPYSGEGCTEGDCYGTDICMTADDFCSRGKRKNPTEF